ncbi:hypothetical protein ACRRTK_017575 [Alexandromys fortis]
MISQEPPPPLPPTHSTRPWVRLSKMMDKMPQRLEARHVPALASHPRPCP